MNAATAVASQAPGRTSNSRGFGNLALIGSVATVAAVAVTTLAAALARAVGVDFQVSDGSETVPLAGIATVTGFLSAMGVVIAAALLRWSTRPADRFVQTALSLTAISLVPPCLAGTGAATITALVGLHLVAAAVMVPAVSWSLRATSTAPRSSGTAQGQHTSLAQLDQSLSQLVRHPSLRARGVVERDDQ